jgi:hypothetical protein
MSSFGQPALSARDLHAIKNIALRNIDSNLIEDWIERAYRHYSKTYHTPLEQAYEVPAHKVALIMLEDMFNNTDPDQLASAKEEVEKELSKLVLSGDKKVLTANAEISDDEWMANQLEELKKKGAIQANESATKAIQKAAATISDAAQQLVNSVNEQLPEEGQITFEE